MTLPIFVPSLNSLNPLSNVIGAATLTMFVLSFPSGLLAIPLSFIASGLFRIDTNSIGGEYLGVCLMFALGAVQWFWLVPSLWRRRTAMEYLDSLPNDVTSFAEADTPVEFGVAADQTPLEKIFKE